MAKVVFTLTDMPDGGVGVEADFGEPLNKDSDAHNLGAYLLLQARDAGVDKDQPIKPGGLPEAAS